MRALDACCELRVAQAGLKRKHQNNCGLFNDWMGRAGHGQFARWVQTVQESGKKLPVLEPLLDEDGTPVRVSPASIIEYVMKMAHGDAQAWAVSGVAQGGQGGEGEGGAARS